MLSNSRKVHARHLRCAINGKNGETSALSKLADEAIIYKQSLNPNDRVVKALGIDVSAIHMGTLEIWGIDDCTRRELLDSLEDADVILECEVGDGSHGWRSVRINNVHLDSFNRVGTAEARGREGVMRMSYRF